MRNKKVLLSLVIVMLFALSATLLSCNRDNGGNNNSNAVTFTKENVNAFAQAIDFGDNFKVVSQFGDMSMEMGYSKKQDGSFIARMAQSSTYEGQPAIMESYMGKVGDQWWLYEREAYGENEVFGKSKMTQYEALDDSEMFTEMLEGLSGAFTGPEIEYEQQTSKMYGEEFGTFTVSGSGETVDGNPTMLKSGEIVVDSVTVNSFTPSFGMSYNLDNVPMTRKIVINIVDGKVTSFTVNETVQPEYAPTNMRAADLSQTVSYTFTYGEVLQMPVWTAEDETRTDAATIYIDDATINGSSSLENQVRGDKIALPSPDAIVGAEFGGWYYDSGYKNVINGEFEVEYSGDSSVYAKWNVGRPTLHFNGGFYYYDEMNYINNAAVLLGDMYEYEPQKAGYAFDGWYTDEGLTNKVLNSDTTVLSSSMTLYAKWVSLVKLTVNAGVDYSVLPIFIAPGYSNYINEHSYVRKGKHYSGLYLDAECTQQFSTAPGADTTLYAKYVDTVAITLNIDGVKAKAILPVYINLNSYSNMGNIENALFNYYDGITYEEGGATYQCVGWYTDAARENVFNELPTADITIYPKFGIVE
ncbi:MAG TPA: InlB B-repeat-containing protein [Clostridia bacterium]|nr:InlB B-repeat-containing protein [Clostridia bacterium]